MSLLSATSGTTLLIAWLMVSTLYPVLISSPKTGQVAKKATQQSSTIIHIPSKVVYDDSNYQSALQEIENLNTVISSLRAQVHNASANVPTEEKLVSSILHKLPPPPKPMLCPPPPTFVVSEESYSQIEEIKTRQEDIIYQHEEIKDSISKLFQTLSSRPTTVTFECDSIEQSRNEITTMVESAIKLSNATQSSIDSLQSKLHILNEEKIVRYEQFEQSIQQRIASLVSEWKNYEQTMSEQFLSSARHFSREITTFQGLVNREKAKNDALEKKLTECLEHELPECPTDVVPAHIPSPVCLQPNESMVEQAFQKALSDHIASIRQRVSPKEEKRRNRHSSLTIVDEPKQTILMDYALAISGARVVDELTSATYVPEDFAPLKALENALAVLGLENSEKYSQSIFDNLHVDYGVGSTLEALDTSTEPGRCWGMKVIYFNSFLFPLNCDFNWMLIL